VAFHEHPSAEASLRAAVRAARQLPEAHALLHVAELHVHPGGRGVRLAGEALAHPEGGWREGGAGPRATPEAAARLEAGLVHAGTDGTFLLAGDGLSTIPAPSSSHVPPLVGREPLLEALRAEAETCLAAGTPGFTVLTGEVGHGRTRVLEALARRLEAGAWCLGQISRGSTASSLQARNCGHFGSPKQQERGRRAWGLRRGPARRRRRRGRGEWTGRHG
jgi:hypothetical protein